MDHIFQVGDYFTAPDGTDVSAFLNATDITQADLPWGALGDVSIASGRVRAGVHSWVHLHPAVAQVTYMESGGLTVRMKDPDSADFYDNYITSGQAVVARKGTLFQLRNDNDTDASLLYIASPSYVFYVTGGNVVYDDAILVSKTWDELKSRNYQVPKLNINEADLRARRESAQQALMRRKPASPPKNGD